MYEVLNQKFVLIKEDLQYYTLSRRRHDERICAAVSNDGKYLAIAPTFYCIVVKEVKTDVEVAKFHETNGYLNCNRFAKPNPRIMLHVYSCFQQNKWNKLVVRW